MGQRTGGVSVDRLQEDSRGEHRHNSFLPGRREFGEASNGYALYGYEAMSLVLAAIRASGAHGNDRQVVTAHLLATRDRDSVLGRYSLQPDGETTLARYALDRVIDGRQVFVRAVTAP